MIYLGRLREQIGNERGAEIVEWVLWVGGIAVLAGTLYTVLNTQLSATFTTLLSGIGVSGS